MIVDTSALVAVLQDEPESEPIEELLFAHPSAVSTSTLVEMRVVVNARSGAAGLLRLNALLRWMGTEIVPFDLEQADAASDAYRVFGRGSGHPARLNLGDTFSYALAYVRDEPLLYIGDDFSRTGVRSALVELGE